MRDDEIGAGNERARGLDVDVPPAKRIIGQSGQRGGFGGEGPARVLEIDLRLVVQDLGDAPVVGGVGEGQQCDFDDLVVLDAQSGGFAVDVERAAQRRVAGVAQPRGKLDAAQRARARGRFFWVHGWFSVSGG